MAQKFLHATNVGSPVEQMGGETVPQRVGRRPLIEASHGQAHITGDANAGGAIGSDDTHRSKVAPHYLS